MQHRSQGKSLDRNKVWEEYETTEQLGKLGMQLQILDEILGLAIGIRMAVSFTEPVSPFRSISLSVTEWFVVGFFYTMLWFLVDSLY